MLGLIMMIIILVLGVGIGGALLALVICMSVGDDGEL